VNVKNGTLALRGMETTWFGCDCRYSPPSQGTTKESQDSGVMREKPDNLGDEHRSSHSDCSLCRDLLANTRRFFEMLQSVRESYTPDWLTVDEVAEELRISRTIVYRLIRHGELEAVNIVETDSRIAQKGHYRIRRSSLNNYLESKKVRPFSKGPSQRLKCKRFPDVKNHLGL